MIGAVEDWLERQRLPVRVGVLLVVGIPVGALLGGLLGGLVVFLFAFLFPGAMVVVPLAAAAGALLGVGTAILAAIGTVVDAIRGPAVKCWLCGTDLRGEDPSRVHVTDDGPECSDCAAA